MLKSVFLILCLSFVFTTNAGPISTHDKKSLCEAYTTSGWSSCSKIQDFDLAALCRELVSGGFSCRGIFDFDYRRFCEAVKTNRSDLCYSMFDYDLQQTCLAVSSHSDFFCDVIGDRESRLLCEGMGRRDYRKCEEI